MADLPDYYTQAQISEAEAAKFKGGLAANKSLTPVSRDIYLGTDNHILYVCVVDGAWVGLDAATLDQGILTLYANLAGGGFEIENIADPTAAQSAATAAFVLAQDVLEAAARDAAILVETNARIAADALRLLLTGGTMAGNIIMGGNKLTGLGAGVAAGESVRYEQLPTIAISTGSYVGDSTVNRAIPHGLGATPDLVFIKATGQVNYYGIFGVEGFICLISGNQGLAVTIPDAVDFYVGNATSYTWSANETAWPFTWVAIRS